MPALQEGPPSPFLKTIFSRRETEPLYIAIQDEQPDVEEGLLRQSEDDEKPAVPNIVVTPSTPKAEHRSIFQPRLPQYPMFPPEEQDEIFFAAAEAYKLRHQGNGQYTLSRIRWTFSSTPVSSSSSLVPSLASRVLNSREGRLCILVALLLMAVIAHVLITVLKPASSPLSV